ncbi:PD-(D/E)XK nuclease family protein [Bordetella genomosp. 4]|uniref:PD-(D/E)XK nuclease family protein n=1 Tax=Bordetella genomosp. 4 TaxID=463044 RepID=UPI0020CF2C3F|nr:PD-(D/E)XK nuclease family protein [Bordetella genomosp. 4]
MNYDAEFRSLISLEHVGRLPAAQTLVLTVNNRLARRLTLDLAGQLRRERQVSELPRVLPLGAWLVEAGADLAFVADADLPAHRLDTFATQMVWVDAIAAEEGDRVLLDVAQAAALAMDADALMDEWDLQVPSGADTDEYRGFARWRARYREQLRSIDAEDANQGYARVLDALQQGGVAAPPYLVLAGFTDVSPRFAALLDAFQDRGSQLSWLQDAEAEAATPVRYCADDLGGEWRAAAAWASQRLDENPAGRYAIVSAQLQSESPFARRVVGQALAQRGHAFNVAVGRPLTEWPAVRAALAWLHALADMAYADAVDTPVLGAALLAGHCAGDRTDGAKLATIDARWRRKGLSRIDAAQWQRDIAVENARKANLALAGVTGNTAVDVVQDVGNNVAGSTGTASSATKGTTLSTAWPAAVEIWRQVGERATCDLWMPAMRAALVALGFPGERPLDSVGYQVMGALGDLFGRYAALAPAAGQLNGRAAVRLLERAAAASSFQPQRDPSARLDVLGLLEAEGGHWDGVWILGLTDDVLPATPQPNPLLPLVVLRQAGAPRATPERERQWAESMYAALCRCAPEVVVSHSHLDGERELRPSPLIAQVPLMDWQMPVAAAPALLPQQVLDDDRGPALAQRDDPVSSLIQRSSDNGSASTMSSGASAGEYDAALPLALGDEQPSALTSARLAGATGGLDVLDTQARNPLWAFVRHRLGARALSDYADMANQNVRGQFLHRALELVWRMFSSQEDLHAAMEEGRLSSLIDQAIDEAASTELKTYPPALRELECDRGRTVLAGWFDVEAQRMPFEVAQVEETHHWSRGPLALTVRLDRLDRLPDGRAVIVDYKTGMSPGNPESDWARVRPVNLQLPFYASVLSGDTPDADVAALVLAQVHARQVVASGLTDTDLGMPGVTAIDKSKAFEGQAWGDILHRWRGAVEGLADEYAAGYAANLVYRRDDLKYCDAMPFLRLHLEDEDDAE